MWPTAHFVSAFFPSFRRRRNHHYTNLLLAVAHLTQAHRSILCSFNDFWLCCVSVLHFSGCIFRLDAFIKSDNSLSLYPSLSLFLSFPLSLSLLFACFSLDPVIEVILLRQIEPNRKHRTMKARKPFCRVFCLFFTTLTTKYTEYSYPN